MLFRSILFKKIETTEQCCLDTFFDHHALRRNAGVLKVHVRRHMIAIVGLSSYALDVSYILLPFPVLVQVLYLCFLVALAASWSKRMRKMFSASFIRKLMVLIYEPDVSCVSRANKIGGFEIISKIYMTT